MSFRAPHNPHVPTLFGLDKAGVNYDPFGNTTSLPASDAGGSNLMSTYYVNDTLASQEQNGESISYGLDPAGRTLTTTSKGATNSVVVSHYAGAGDSPAWTINETTGVWSRNVGGVGTELAATQTRGEAPVLELTDLHGDIIGTAAISETQSKLVPDEETNEYGVPRRSVTSKYLWLGADRVPTELPTGIVNMGARSYIPRLGRFEQTDPQPGGSINSYAYTSDDPVNEGDTSGEWTSTITYDEEAVDTGEGTNLTGGVGIEPGAIMPPPVNMQIEEEFNAHPPWDPVSIDPEFRVDECLFTSAASWNADEPDILSFVTTFRCSPRAYVRAWNFAGATETEKFEKTNGKPLAGGAFVREINLLLDAPFPLDVGACAETRAGRPGSNWGPPTCVPFDLEDFPGP